MLIVSRLGKRFGRHRVLDDVSFRCDAGDIVAIVGENGSGKSTLLGILAGQLEADAGDATLAGAPLLGSRADRARIGFVPEGANPPGRMTGSQLLALVASLKKSPLPDADALAALGVERVLDQPIASLSLGQRRRLCLRAALIGDPALLLLDEPSNGLDDAGVDALVDTLATAGRRGTMVVLATHDRALVQRLDARVVPLQNGRVIDAAEEE